MLFPPGEWVFVAQGGDVSNKIIYGFRFYPASTTTVTSHSENLAVDPTDAIFSITSAGKVFWGGDTYHTSYGQTVQYTRLYLDYVPNSSGQMLNLAWMQPGGIYNQILLFNSIFHTLGTLYVFHLSTDYDAVTNATIPLVIYQDTAQTISTAPICNRIPHKPFALNF